MGCIVSKLFLDFYIFFIFTRPLNCFFYLLCVDIMCNSCTLFLISRNKILLSVVRYAVNTVRINFTCYCFWKFINFIVCKNPYRKFILAKSCFVLA